MLKIPEYWRVTPEISAKYGKYMPLLDKFPTQPDSGSAGMYAIPKIGKTTGFYFIVLVGTGNAISVQLNTEPRQPNTVELLYVRNLFFDPGDVVVQFIPSDPMRLHSLGKAVALWRLERTDKIPSDKEIGNL